jgi:hypothetical protein
MKLPELNPITVHVNKLVLDPNNPRLITSSCERFPEDRFLDADVISKTKDKMESGFKIDELKNSIIRNGFFDIDKIFVRKHSDGNHYIVLEGNRRTTALLSIINDDNIESSLKKRIETINCLELICENLSENEIYEQIDYILGVRHHGSLKKWTPFAQATDIYEKYCKIGEYTWDSFEWSDGSFGKVIAEQLSIEPDDVKNRLITYRAMVDMNNWLSKNKHAYTIKSKDYSLFSDCFVSTTKSLSKYLRQDANTFLLEDDTKEKLDLLCQFSLGRPNVTPPVNVPKEWSWLSKILSHPESDKRDQGMKLVENDLDHPSVAYEKICPSPYTWEKWLREVNTKIKNINIGNLDEENKDELNVIKEIDMIIHELL